MRPFLLSLLLLATLFFSTFPFSFPIFPTLPTFQTFQTFPFLTSLSRFAFSAAKAATVSSNSGLTGNLIAKRPKVLAKKLVVLGDSLSEGYGVSRESAYPALLEKKLHDAGKAEWQVVNAGVSGSTSASAVSRMQWLFKSKPEVVIIVLGANDGLRGLKIEETQRNLSEAILYAQSNKVKVILGGLYMPPNYGKDYTTQFRKMYQDLSKKHRVTLIPFVLEGVAGNPKYNLADGIHPNEEGHKIIAENVFKILRDSL